MNIKKGEIYVCREPYCGAEIEVIRGANQTCHGKFNLSCCCGKEMFLKVEQEVKQAAAVGAAS
jgi:hypothetical protein